MATASGEVQKDDATGKKSGFQEAVYGGSGWTVVYKGTGENGAGLKRYVVSGKENEGWSGQGENEVQEG